MTRERAKQILREVWGQSRILRGDEAAEDLDDARNWRVRRLLTDCPNCAGEGCPTCGGSGSVRVPLDDEPLSGEELCDQPTRSPDA